ncbi:MAG TPA: HAD hydrolase-like protein [Acidimicrobiales bacterium]|jgi:phosphoglycolate phosphatase|nr:HAD hydrolase-like protein [Acidimicrobiales bacterium]
MSEWPEAVLFDFDGTLVDSSDVIVAALRVALERGGVAHAHLDPAELGGHIGVPLPVLLPELGIPPAGVSASILAFQAYFAEHGPAGTTPYAGAARLLDELTAAGVALAVATAKPRRVAQEVIDHLGWSAKFAVLAGANDDESGGAKDEVIGRALAALTDDRAVPLDIAGVVMVGDRASDIAGAHHHGIAAIGVRWGYGSRRELEGAGPFAVADDVAHLRALLRSFGARATSADPDPGGTRRSRPGEATASARRRATS